MNSVELTDDILTSADCVVIVTNHKAFDMKRIVEKAKLVVDLKNATAGIDDKEKIYRL